MSKVDPVPLSIPVVPAVVSYAGEHAKLQKVLDAMLVTVTTFEEAIEVLRDLAPREEHF